MTKRIIKIQPNENTVTITTPNTQIFGVQEVTNIELEENLSYEFLLYCKLLLTLSDNPHHANLTIITKLDKAKHLRYCINNQIETWVQL